MEKLKAIISKGPDDYGVWIENLEGVYSAAETVKEAKEGIHLALEAYIKHNKELPSILKNDYEFVYKFDVESLLSYYKGILTNSAFERITGINQKQLQHYASGMRKPREEQRQKIEKALHALGEELLAIEL